MEELKLKINLTNLKKYCAHGFFPMQLTPFEDVFKLEGSHNLSLDLITMNLKKNKYWNYSLEPNFKLNEKEWSEKIYFLLDKSVKQRLVADVPIGVFLSGGLDSSIISLHCSIFRDDKGDEAGIFKSAQIEIISGESTFKAFASSFTLNLATLKIIVFDDPIKIYVFIFLFYCYVYRYKNSN